MTTDQIRARTKTVTRRKGWRFLMPGDRLTACVKCMGLKPGAKIERLCTIEVVAVNSEELSLITPNEVTREGFPGMSPAEFVAMFCEHMGGYPRQIVTRIEFRYIDGKGGGK